MRSADGFRLTEKSAPPTVRENPLRQPFLRIRGAGGFSLILSQTKMISHDDSQSDDISSDSVSSRLSVRLSLVRLSRIVMMSHDLT